MKKRTDEEKRQMIDEACDKFNEAAALIKEGRRLFHLCGIEMCDRFEIERPWGTHSCNCQIFSGIRTMEKLLGVEGYFAKDLCTGKEDKSALLIKHKGLVFLQGCEPISTVADILERLKEHEEKGGK